MVWMLMGLVAAGVVLVALTVRRRIAVRAWDAELADLFVRDDPPSTLGRHVRRASPKV